MRLRHSVVCFGCFFCFYLWLSFFPFLQFAIQRHYLNFITFLIKHQMNTNLIYSTLSEGSLYLDETVLTDIKSFIQTFLGDAWKINPKLYISVCTAIVCECKRVPAIQAPINVPFGLTVEKVIKYIPDIPREQFLTTIIRIVQKWPTCPSQFTHKLQNLKLSLRVFKKYMLTCKSIGEKLNVDPRNNYHISALFWLIYLIGKSSHREPESLEVMTTIIPFLIFQLYTTYLMLGRKQIVDDVIGKFFTISAQPSQSMKHMELKYEKQFQKILDESYSKRFLENPSNYNCLVHKPLYVQRLIDDLSNRYAEAIYNSPHFSIDQMSFLQIKKDITPLPFHEKNDKIGFIISEKISFDSDRPSIQQNTPKRRANLINNNINDSTPVTKRFQKLSWIRNCIQNLEQSKFQNVENCYKLYNKQHSFKEFTEKAYQKLEKIIQQFSPTYKDPERRKLQIYKFFVYCINLAIDMYKEDIQKIFKSDLKIFTIFCLCTEIFNFVYQTFSGNYSKYLSIFQVDNINAFWPINWFGYYLKAPNSVGDHLFELERNFLLKQIWLTDLGYKILSNRSQEVAIVQQKMLQRMKQHIKWRVDQMCQVSKISNRQMSKINKMILHLIQKKPELLKNNNIDQIAICCITSCLSFKEENNNHELEKIFVYYQKVILDTQNEQKIYDSDKKEMSIIQFYNQIFLVEVEQLLNKYPESSNVLLTPKKLQHTQKYQNYLQNNEEKNNPSFLALPKKVIPSQTRSKQHQSNVAKKIKIKQESQMLDQSEQSSVLQIDQNQMQNKKL